MAIKFAAKDLARQETGKPAKDLKPADVAVEQQRDGAEGAPDLFQSEHKKPSRKAKAT